MKQERRLPSVSARWREGFSIGEGDARLAAGASFDSEDMASRG